VERAAFLIDPGGARLGCLLNPETLVVRRTAGLRARHSLGGPLTAAASSDDPLIYTGGGTTELYLELLFDVSLVGSTIHTVDVRDLTRPLWELAENAFDLGGYLRPPTARFVWGKAWNMLCVVAALAERLEEFVPGGAPRRSWLHMKLLRVAEPAGAEAPALDPVTAPALLEAPEELAHEALHDVEMHEVSGASGDAPGSTDRLDEVAHRYYGDASLWRVIAQVNRIADPLRVAAGTLLKIPKLMLPRKAP
jgi:contractile injection system tube protein